MTHDDGSWNRVPPARQLTVLLIDDLDTVVDVLAAALTQAGYKVITALSGKDALNLFGNNRVDVILSDLCMPDMNGLDVARAVSHLCATRGLKRPPVILVTGCADRISSDYRITQLGVAAVIGKPVDLPQLVSVIERALQRI